MEGISGTERTRVLIAAPLDEEDLRTIGQVDPRVEVIYGLDLIISELGHSLQTMPPWSAKMSRIVPSRAEASSQLDSILRLTDVIFGWRLPLDLPRRALKLKWVQGVGAGVDLLAGNSGLKEMDVMLTNAGGLHSVGMREHVFWMMLSMVREGKRLHEGQQSRTWQHVEPSQLAGKTLGVVGLGKIGSSLVAAARAFEMKVIAVRNSAGPPVRRAGDVELIYPPGDMHSLLAASDYVVLALPLTVETRHLIGEPELRVMKPSACLINISRGAVIDETALLRALKERWIAGAALDVFEHEPLPADSEFWRMPNVIVTPHVAGAAPDYRRQVTALFCRNLRLFLAGEALFNAVDRSRGY